MKSRLVLCLSICLSTALGAGDASALPLGKKTCAELKKEHGALVGQGVLRTMAKGPDWAGANLKPNAIARIKRFLTIEGRLQFRCAGGGVQMAELPQPPARVVPAVAAARLRGLIVPLPRRSDKKTPLVAKTAVAPLAPVKVKPLYPAATVPPNTTIVPKRNEKRRAALLRESARPESAPPKPDQVPGNPPTTGATAGLEVPLPTRRPRYRRPASRAVVRSAAPEKLQKKARTGEDVLSIGD